MTPSRFVRVPLPIVNGLIGYLVKRPYEEVHELIGFFSSLPVEQVVEPQVLPVKQNKQTKE